MSNVGKFDAEQRERLRQFTQQVVTRAEAEASSATQTHSGGSSPTGSSAHGSDVQEIIDELRAEIAQLRAALQDYRQSRALRNFGRTGFAKTPWSPIQF